MRDKIAPSGFAYIASPFLCRSDKMVLKAALLFTFCVSLLFAQSPVLSPPVVITYLGGEIHFICTKDPSMQMAWYAPSIPSFFHNNGMNSSQLKIYVVDFTLNNTVVQCVTRDPSQPSKLYYSNPVKIVIQGISNLMSLYVLYYCTYRFSFGNHYQ